MEFKLESPTARDLVLDRVRRALYPLTIADGRARMRDHDGYCNGSGIVYLRCLYHRERTPSLAVYPSGDAFCYGC